MKANKHLSISRLKQKNVIYKRKAIKPADDGFFFSAKQKAKIYSFHFLFIHTIS